MASGWMCFDLLGLVPILGMIVPIWAFSNIGKINSLLSVEFLTDTGGP
jgi:hypothetical protein